jgi:C4-dicarboxylate-specific signal transduction histidine kinase
VQLAHAGRVTLLGELSASIAHELKQPLTAILTDSQAALRFLGQEPADLGEIRQILNDIAASDRRASEIIERIHAMMRKGEAQFELLNVEAEIEQVLRLIRSDLVARKVTVETQFSSNLPPVKADRVQLQQLLLNLIVNACEAMAGSPPEQRRVRIETGCDGSASARVSVADRGSGVPPEMLDRIFRPFFTTKGTGLGMGLAICQGIVRSHGGRLWVSNNPERGATFRFTLALAARQKEAGQ